jgi:hypothetical protein
MFHKSACIQIKISNPIREVFNLKFESATKGEVISHSLVIYQCWVVIRNMNRPQRLSGDS